MLRSFLLSLIVFSLPACAADKPATAEPAAGSGQTATASPDPKATTRITFTECHVDGPFIAFTFDDGPHPTQTPRLPYVTQALVGAEGPVVVTSDWIKSVNDMPARWIPNRFVALGADGYGRSDTREALRRHFETDAEHMVVATLHALMQDALVKPETVAKAIADYGLNADIVDPRDA